MKRNHILFSMLLVLGMPSIAYAHGLAVYASTPVTPPEGWLWVPVVFVIGIILLDYLVLAKIIPMSRLIWGEILILFIFFIVFFGLGSFAAMTSTAPPPGLGPPHRAFYGMSLLRAGSVFLAFNVLGLALFYCARRLLCGILKITEPDMRRKFLGAGVIVYLAVLIPYVIANAMTHGWPGGYVTMQCEKKQEMIGAGLARYAEAHDGSLPNAEKMEDIMVAIRPYISEDRDGWFEPVDICPLEDVYERNPRSYLWNPRFSGARLDISGEYDENEPVIRCPAIHDFGDPPALYYHDLITLQAIHRTDLL